MPPGISSWIVEGWDSAVLQITGSTWGVPHSPGYPLYTIAANLFSRLVGWVAPASAVTWRVSLWSTTTSLLTLLCVYFIVRRIGRDWVGALVAAGLLGTSFIFWRASIMAEVYSLNGLIFALTFWLAVTLPAEEEAAARDRRLVALGLVLGAGLVHHRTAFILPPAVALWLLAGARSWRRAGRDLALTAGVAVLPLLTYLYLPLAARTRAGQTWLYADTADWNVFWFVVLAREWWGLVQPPGSLADWAAGLEALFGQQAAQITPLGVGLGLAGLIGLRRYWLLFGPPLLALSFFGLSYRVADLDSMLVPLTLTLVIGAGALVGLALARLGRRRPGGRERYGPWLRPAASLALALGLFLWLRPLVTATYEAVDLSDDWQAEDLVEEVVAIAGAGTPLAIIGQDNSVLPDFIYAQTVLGQPVRPLSTTTLARLHDADSAALVRAQLQAGRRVLIDRETVDLHMIPWINRALDEGRFFLAPTGHPVLWELLPLPPPRALPPAEAVRALPLGGFLDGDLSLAGYHQRLIRKRTGCFLRLSLFWRAERDLDQDYFVAVHPAGGEGALAAEDHLGLMRGYWPTSRMTAGAVIRDEVDLPVRQPEALAGLSLVVRLYQVQGNEFPAFGEVTLPITGLAPACGAEVSL